MERSWPGAQRGSCGSDERIRKPQPGSAAMLASGVRSGGGEGSVVRRAERMPPLFGTTQYWWYRTKSNISVAARQWQPWRGLVDTRKAFNFAAQQFVRAVNDEHGGASACRWIWWQPWTLALWRVPGVLEPFCWFPCACDYGPNSARFRGISRWPYSDRLSVKCQLPTANCRSNEDRQPTWSGMRRPRVGHDGR